MPAGTQSRALVRAEMLEWIARVGAGTAEALAHAHTLGASSVRARLAAPERAGLLARRRLLAGRPAIYTLTAAGLRACGRTGDATRVSAANAMHLIACASVAAALESCYADQIVIGERELRRAESELGRTLASASLSAAPAERSSGEQALLHRPDLVLLPREPLSGQLPVAVEVELTVKAPRRLLAICRAWARCRDVAGVLYLAAPAAERALRRAIAQVDAQREVALLPLGALAELEMIARASWAREPRTATPRAGARTVPARA